MLVLAGSELRSRFHHALYVALKRPAAHCLPASTQPDIAFGAKGFSGRFPGGLRSCEGRPLRRGEKGEEEGGASSEQGLEALVSGSVRDTNSGAKALPEHSPVAPVRPEARLKLLGLLRIDEHWRWRGGACAVGPVARAAGGFLEHSTNRAVVREVLLRLQREDRAAGRLRKNCGHEALVRF